MTSSHCNLTLSYWILSPSSSANSYIGIQATHSWWQKEIKSSSPSANEPLLQFIIPYISRYSIQYRVKHLYHLEANTRKSLHASMLATRQINQLAGDGKPFWFHNPKPQRWMVISSCKINFSLYFLWMQPNCLLSFQK